MAGGKHSSDGGSFEFNFKPLNGKLKSINWIKVLVIITILVVIGGSILCAKMIIESKNAQNNNQEAEPVVQEKSGLPNDLDGYEILGKIKIDKINVEQYILNSKESEALEKGVSKLYGNELNGYGNFCISGHNYENIFAKLNELEVGDNFKIIDKEEKETNYRIKEIYQVEPDNLECLIQDEEKIEVTLITCENGATTRLIVKAEKDVTENEVENTDTNDKENV